MKLPIPVNIITGPLGAGKSTCIAQLVARKPSDERWTIIVNEFGLLGIDEAILEASEDTTVSKTVTVKQLAGGCMCCALSGPLNVAIAQTVRLTKPDRLLIEPSGLGHPGGLLDVMRSEHLARVLDVKAVLCLVDVGVFQPCDYDGNPIISNQVDVCDVLVANKCDTAAPQAVQQFLQWAAELFPPKHEVLTASQGVLDLRLLDLPREPQHVPLISAAAPHSRGRRSKGGGSWAQQQVQQVEGQEAAHTVQQLSSLPDQHAPQQQLLLPQLLPGQPAAVPSASSGPARSCGWLFHPDDCFDRKRLLQLMARLVLVALRVKGVFRVGQEWVVLGQVSGGQQIELRPICYRRESRVEVIMQVQQAGWQRHQRGALLERAAGEAGQAAQAGAADGQATAAGTSGEAAVAAAAGAAAAGAAGGIAAEAAEKAAGESNVTAAGAADETAAGSGEAAGDPDVTAEAFTALTVAEAAQGLHGAASTIPGGDLARAVACNASSVGAGLQLGRSAAGSAPGSTSAATPLCSSSSTLSLDDANVNSAVAMAAAGSWSELEKLLKLCLIG